MTTSYRTTEVPVRGGELAVGVWGPDDAPAVLAIHGVTSSHTTWLSLAEALPDIRILAPDLRGRGRSNALPGPWGMPSHADDMKALLEAFGVGPAGLTPVVVLGHSMGAFVAATMARRHPEAVSELVLVDGGLPIPAPPGIAAEDVPQAIIGPALDRLSMTFASREAYRDYWLDHPAFADDWSPAVEAYVDYDLEGEAPAFSPSAAPEAVAQDSLELSGDVGYAAALAEIDVPVTFLRAARGLLNEPQALYATSTVEEWKARMPGLTALEIADVNHYTIVMSRRGAEQVAAVVRRAAG